MLASLLASTVVLAGCARDDADGGAGDRAPVAAGGRTCAGWVTVDAVQAVLPRPLEDHDHRLVAPDLPAIMRCEFLDGETTVLALWADDWDRAAEVDHRTAGEDPRAVEGPLDGSVIGVLGQRDGRDRWFAQARIELPEGPERRLLATTAWPPDEDPPIDLLAELLLQLHQSATEGPPAQT